MLLVWLFSVTAAASAATAATFATATATPAATTTATATPTAAPAATTTATATPTAATAATTTATPTAATAATTTGRVGVADDEPTSHQTFHVVDLGALDQRYAVWIYHYADVLRLDHYVVFGGFLLDAKHVLKATVAPRRDHDPEQRALATLVSQHFAQLGRS